MFGNIAQHHGTRANTAVLADHNVAENFRSSSNDHAIFDGGMPFPVLFSRATESHALIEGHIVADDAGLANHDAHAVIDEEAAANLRGGMNFNSGEQARDLRKPAPEEKETVVPQPMIDAVEPDRVQAGVAE